MPSISFCAAPSNASRPLHPLSISCPFSTHTATNWRRTVPHNLLHPCDVRLHFLSPQVQIGGGRTRRLEENEYPLLVQEEFLKSLGYFDESRRARLGIDPELKYLIRFHIGPAEIPMCKGVLRSGSVEVLKGLMFPQWRRRHLAIVGSKLILYAGEWAVWAFFL